MHPRTPTVEEQRSDREAARGGVRGFVVGAPSFGG